MIRKLLALLCCLLLALPCALAEELNVAATPYTLDDIGVTLSVPDEFNIVLTTGMDENDPVFATLGLTKADVDAIMAASSFYLDAMVLTAAGATKELTLQVQNMQAQLQAQGLSTLHGVSDAELDDFVEGMRLSYTAQGITILDSEALRLDDLTFVVIYVEVPSTGYAGIQALTLHNYNMYCLSLTSYLGVVEEADLINVAHMLATITIAQ